MSLLNVSGISKNEGENYLLKNINFVQEPLQKIAIAGITGSGKTTLLKIIAAWIQPDSGEVFFEGTRIKGPQEKLLPGHSSIAYLSQHFELRNHYRVEEILQMSTQLSDADASSVCKVCRINHLLNRWTDQLSGGERQRVALARVLTSAPKLLLLDEPFSNLDAIHRHILKAVINDISEQLQITCILVSHDPNDLLSWADEIIVLNQGIIIQRGTPEELYRQPVNEYVAALLGKYNVLSDSLFHILIPDKNKRFIRPESIEISKENTGAQGRVTAISFMGSYYEIELEMNDQSKLIINHKVALNKGDVVSIKLV